MMFKYFITSPGNRFHAKSSREVQFKAATGNWRDSCLANIILLIKLSEFVQQFADTKLYYFSKELVELSKHVDCLVPC